MPQTDNACAGFNYHCFISTDDPLKSDGTVPRKSERKKAPPFRLRVAVNPPVAKQRTRASNAEYSKRYRDKVKKENPAKHQLMKEQSKLRFQKSLEKQKSDPEEVKRARYLRKLETNRVCSYLHY